MLATDFRQRPILVFWECTKACLLACKHCRANALKNHLPGTLSTAEGEKMIRELMEFGKPLPALIITGGDPFMRGDLFELIEYAKSLNVGVGLAPAVTPIMSSLFILLKRLGVKAVSISLDGAQAKTHDQVRGTPGHFLKTMRQIRYLISHGFTVQVNTTVMKENVEELADIAGLLSSMKVPIWEVFFLVKVGRGEAVEEITPEECEEVCHFLFDASQYGFVVRTVEAPFFRRVVLQRKSQHFEISAGALYKKLSSRLVELLGTPAQESLAQTRGTRDGSGILFVGYNGDVYPAGFLPVTVGNIKEKNLCEIYRKSPLLSAIREAKFKGKCGICEYREICGGSRSRAYAAHGDPLASDPACVYVPKNQAIQTASGEKSNIQPK